MLQIRKNRNFSIRATRDTFRSSSVRTLKRIGREQQAAQPRRYAKTEEEAEW